MIAFALDYWFVILVKCTKLNYFALHLNKLQAEYLFTGCTPLYEH